MIKIFQHLNSYHIYVITVPYLPTCLPQVAAGIATFVLKGDMKTEITKNMEKSLKNYGSEGHDGVTQTWDLVQKEFKCCGVEDWTDWKEVTGDAVPDSCCIVRYCHAVLLGTISCVVGRPGGRVWTSSCGYNQDI